MLCHNALKCDAGGEKGKQLCCKRIFNQVKGNLAEAQPNDHQNVQKNALFAKSSRSQWLNILLHFEFKNKATWVNLQENKRILKW